MYHRLGESVSRYPKVVVLCWVALLAGLLTFAPPPQSVARDGVFKFLPPGSPSVEAIELFKKAFPVEADANAEVHQNQQDPLGSNVVIVVQREDLPTGLTADDKDFIEKILKPKLADFRLTTPAGREFKPGMAFPPVAAKDRRIKFIWTPGGGSAGILLESADHKSQLVVIELTGEFLDYDNSLVIGRIEQLLESEAVDGKKPAGLDLALSGSAVVGRDMLLAEKQSAKNTDFTTKILVVALLLLIYWAPVVAMIPLVTVGISVVVAIRLLSLMAHAGWIGFFAGMNVYVTVVVYGAGVDYCIFLIARYREQLDHGTGYDESVAKAVGFVGAALAASAGASICGISMMMFAEFGKFRQAGFAISFGLLIALLCSLSLTPAMLRLVAPWAFWPNVRREHLGAGGGWITSPGVLEKFQESKWFDRAWEWMAKVLRAHPGTIFVGSFLLMTPFAVAGGMLHDKLSYGLLTDIPQTSASVRGARAIQKHFPAGMAGVTTILLKSERFRAEDEGPDDTSVTGVLRRERIADAIVQVLQPRFQELGIVDVRSQKTPLGVLDNAKDFFNGLKVGPRKTVMIAARNAYSSRTGPYAGEVIRLDLVFDRDPFSRDSINQLSVVEQAVADAVREPEEVDDDGPHNGPLSVALQAATQKFSLGSTASIRDLRAVTDRDQIRIDVLVVVAVYVVLLIMLRQPWVSAFLILSVVFSYMVTMGMTFLVFWAKSPATFAGLDWKVPIFTFTLLIALGEDYNILLMARVTEEQKKHGLVEGVLIALTKTGGIISSCGVIMAGTFCSLLFGTLSGMVQMGFALAFGVMLDTFIVRPILVPAFLILLYEGKFGWFGRIMGSGHRMPESPLMHAIEGEEIPDDDAPPPAAGSSPDAK
jgi:RND superfamily putative drug exporter